MAKKPTFAEKKDELLGYLKTQGWEVREMGPSYKPMKVPHATSPDGTIRLWFKTHAIYHASHAYRGGSFDLGSAHSMSSDMRELDGPSLVATAQRWKSS